MTCGRYYYNGWDNDNYVFNIDEMIALGYTTWKFTNFTATSNWYFRYQTSQMAYQGDFSATGILNFSELAHDSSTTITITVMNSYNGSTSYKVVLE